MPPCGPRVSKANPLLQNYTSKSLPLWGFFSCLRCAHSSYNLQEHFLQFLHLQREVFPQREGEGRAQLRCGGLCGRVRLPRAAHQRAPAPTPRRPFLTRGQVLKVPVLAKAFLSAPAPSSAPFIPRLPRLGPPSQSPTPRSLPLTFPRQPREGATFPAPLTHPPTWNSPRKLGPSLEGISGAQQGPGWTGAPLPCPPPSPPPPPLPAGLGENTAPGRPGAHCSRSLE